MSFHHSVTEVEDKVRGCTQLKEVVLNEGLQKIGEWAFMECKSLKSITFPSTLREIGDYAFFGCGINKILFNEGAAKYW